MDADGIAKRLLTDSKCVNSMPRNPPAKDKR